MFEEVLLTTREQSSEYSKAKQYPSKTFQCAKLQIVRHGYMRQSWEPSAKPTNPPNSQISGLGKGETPSNAKEEAVHVMDGPLVSNYSLRYSLPPKKEATDAAMNAKFKLYKLLSREVGW